MAKVKPHRKKPTLDMTPVVDLAFLLVTFFMLTAKFRPDEPVVVDMPSSYADIKIPDKNILTLTVSKDNKVFFNVDNKNNRYSFISRLSEVRGLNLSEEEKNSYAIMSSVGMPFNQLKSFLAMEPDDRKAVQQSGIPCDSANNELKDWVLYARLTNPKLRVAIKGDGDANYPIVQKVIATLQDDQVKVNRFNLITNLEKEQ